MKHWFISDLHIKDINERNGNTLLRFFFYLNQNPKDHTVYFLGDIFDLWLSDGYFFQDHYRFLIEQIQMFKKNGGELIYFEGNHDFHIDRFWTRQLNIRVIENEAYFKIDDLIVRCEHGDYINPDDLAYLKYRMSVRKPWVEFIAHVIPGFFWQWFGSKMSAQSRKRTSQYVSQQTEKIKTMIQAYAMKVYNSEHFDLIVTGHMHVFDDFEFTGENQKKIRSVNLGTWLESPRALCIENNHIHIVNVNEIIAAK